MTRAITRPGRLALALGVGLSLPALFVGPHEDDFFHRLALSGRVPSFQRDAFSLYEFLRDSGETSRLIERGLLPWFTEPELRVRFLRPLSSALLAFDLNVFGDATWLAALHSILWFSATLLVALWIQRRLLPERAAFWAGVVYAVAGAHAATTTWFAARHVAVSGVFALGAWAVMIGAREPLTERRTRVAAPWLAAALLALGLTGGEAALTVVPLLFGELWFGRSGSPRRRALASLPIAAVVVSYLAVYAASGYGTHGAGSYVSAFDAPLGFLRIAAARLPVLFAEAFTGVPSFLGHFSPGAERILWLVGLGSFIAVVLLFLRIKREGEPPRAWLPLAFVASLVPTAGAILDGRLLLVPMVASSALLGSVLAASFEHAPGVPRRLPQRLIAGVLVTLHLGLSPLVRVLMAGANAGLSRTEAKIPGRARLDCPAGSRLVVANGSDPAVGMYAPAIFALSGITTWTGYSVLTLAPNDLQLERTGPRSFVLRTLGERATTELESIYRSTPLPAGAQVRTEGLSATVESTSSAGPTVVRFELDTELEQSCLVRWAGGPDGRLESFKLPAQGVFSLPHSPGPLGL